MYLNEDFLAKPSVNLTVFRSRMFYVEHQLSAKHRWCYRKPVQWLIFAHKTPHPTIMNSKKIWELSS